MAYFIVKILIGLGLILMVACASAAFKVWLEKDKTKSEPSRKKDDDWSEF
ncbi:hypothetical protein [Enterococcus sp. DIV0800]